MKSTRRATRKTRPAEGDLPAQAGPAQTPTPPAPAPRSVPEGPSLKIPAILLEGDEPAPSAPSAGVQTPAQASGVSGETRELPQAYGTKRLFLTAREPRVLFAHWDLTPKQLQDYSAASVHHHLVLRIHPAQPAGARPMEVHLKPDSLHEFIQVERAGIAYAAELGFYRPDSEWEKIAGAEPVTTPPEAPTEEGPVRFAAFELEPKPAAVKEAAREAAVAGPKSQPTSEARPGKRILPLHTLAQATATAAWPVRVFLPRPLHPGGQPIVDIQSLHVPSAELVPETEIGTASAELSAPVLEWTPAKAKALAELMGQVILPEALPGSAEIPALIAREAAAAAQRPELAGISSPAGAEFGGISSPGGGQPQEQKGFWLTVNAELIIYGGTEPDARVVIGRQTIRLRPDGTFSFRFALPDGQYALPLTATGSQGDVRRVELRFVRETACEGEVGVHAQDPALRPPSADDLLAFDPGL